MVLQSSMQLKFAVGFSRVRVRVECQLFEGDRPQIRSSNLRPELAG
jgi:hypothetical protein